MSKYEKWQQQFVKNPLDYHARLSKRKNSWYDSCQDVKNARQ